MHPKIFYIPNRSKNKAFSPYIEFLGNNISIKDCLPILTFRSILFFQNNPRATYNRHFLRARSHDQRMLTIANPAPKL